MSSSILITGGTGKFGRKFVKHFAAKGWNVYFTSTSLTKGEEFIECESLPDTVKTIEVDLMQKTSPGLLAEKLAQDGVRINHLVNNARSLASLKVNEAGETEREHFLAEYLMDVIVPYELSMALYKTQLGNLKTITNIGSQYGVVAANPYLYDNHAKQSPIQYGVAKAALIHLTKELAVRFAPQKIRVNCIAYGGVEGRVDSVFKQKYAKLTPSQRMLNESELVAPLESLIHDGSSAITGHTLVADGGWSLW